MFIFLCQITAHRNLTMNKLLTRVDIAARCQVAIRTTHRMRLPEPIRFGRLVRWREEDIDAWIAAQGPAATGKTGRPRSSKEGV
jgi:predicted DNA-binding transcriptional regulator AlpA